MGGSQTRVSSSTGGRGCCPLLLPMELGNLPVHCLGQQARKWVFTVLFLTFSIFSSSILKNSCWLSEMCMLKGKGRVSVPTGLFPI